MARPLLSLERARELLMYDAASGLITWRVDVGQRGRAGEPIGYIDKKGYVYFGLDGKYYFAHRVAWLMHHGRWPAGQIDHRDGLKANNRIGNLRDTTQTENMQNHRKARRHNLTGLLGVSKNGSKFQAEILTAGKRMYLGVFTTPELAHAAYLDAKRRHHPTCTI